MADLRQTDLKKRLDELADAYITTHLCDEPEQKDLRFILTEAVRAALGEPTAEMLDEARALPCPKNMGGDPETELCIALWNVQAAARLRELDAEPPKGDE